MPTQGHRPALLGKLWRLLATFRTGTLGISACHQACTASLCNAEAQLVLTSAQHASCSSGAPAAGLLTAPTAAGCQHSPGFRRQPAVLQDGLMSPARVLSRSHYGTAAAAALKEPAVHRVTEEWPDRDPTSTPTHKSELPSSIETGAETLRTSVAPQSSPSAVLLGPRSQNVAAEHIFLLRCGQDEFVAHNPFPTSSGRLLKLYKQMHRHPPRWDDGVNGWVFQMAAHDELMRVLHKAPSTQHSEPAAESNNRKPTVPALLQQVASGRPMDLHPCTHAQSAQLTGLNVRGHPLQGPSHPMQPAVAQQHTTLPMAAVHVHPLPEVAALHPDVMSAEAAAEGAEDAEDVLSNQEAGAEHRAARRAKRLARRLARLAAQALQLEQEGLMDLVQLLPYGHGATYWRMHQVLENVWQKTLGKGGVAGWAEATPSPRDGVTAQHPYSLSYLRCLIKQAQQMQTAESRVQWGWAGALASFVFVFPEANRLVVERPQYANATYLFCLEEPLPIRDQIERLVAVLSAKGVTRACLRRGSPLVLDQGLTQEQRALLVSLGWSQSMTARQLLNFAGERIIHSQTGEQGIADFQRRLDKLLSKGAAEGPMHKPIVTIAG